MGNLPNSRTITLGNNDPVPSALLDELQDCVVSGWRGAFWGRPTVMPLGQVGFTQRTNTVFSGVTMGGSTWESTAANCGLIYQIAIEESDTVQGIGLDVLGTGAAITVQTIYGTASQMDAFSGFTTLSTETFSPTATWQRVEWLPGAAHAFSAQRVTKSNLIWVLIQVNNHVGVRLGGVRPFVSRQP